jgi:hypothetical protein
MQLEDHRIGWAKETMETAAKRIELLEDMLVKYSSALEAVAEDLHQSNETGFWTAGPWADPNTGEGTGGKVEMIRMALGK